MIKDVHYSRTIAARLSPLIDTVDADGLVAELRQLSNSQYRTAGYMLGERLLVGLTVEQYWTIVNALVRHDAKAFLVTLLKGFSEGIQSGKRNVHETGFASFCRTCNDVDAHKVLLQLLPLLDVEDCRLLFSLLGKDEPNQMLQHLLGISTLPCMFLLFVCLRYHEHDKAFLIRAAHFHIKRGDALSFNLASLIKVYFGLDEVKNTFSLRLEPYQLSRIENSFDVFCEVMNF